MTEELKTIDTVDTSPFKKMVMTIGELPTSFVDSMTYYELLAWLCNYLQGTIIPAVNNNGEAVTELQQLYIELKTFVDNYFDNLDVQEEINNKLDAMAEAGTLQEIIGEYLNASAVWGFDTVADMKTSTNLVDGSFAQTLGYHTKNDGGKALYKIRAITNTDVVDEMLIIAMANTDLIAELIIGDNVCPEMLGAYGDGTHDDTVAVAKTVTLSNKIIMNKDYLISSQIRIGDTVDLDIDAKKSSFIYTGNDSAFLLQHLSGANISFGKITADNGGCIEMYSNSGSSDRVQYTNISFLNLKANASSGKCIYGHIQGTGWLTEIKLNGGAMTRGQYGVYLLNDSTGNDYSIDSWRFVNIGFEGTSNNFYFQAISPRRMRDHFFENCRYVENISAPLLETHGNMDRFYFISNGALDETRLNLEVSKLADFKMICPIYESGTTNVIANGLIYNLAKKTYIYDRITWSLPTKNTDYITSGTVRFSRVGNVCIIRIDSLITSAASGNIIDVLPYAPTDTMTNILSNSSLNKFMQVYATTAGVLKFNMPSADIGTSYTGELVYFTGANLG